MSDTQAPTPLRLRVARADTIATGIRRIHLQAADGAPLPAFAPGAHIALQLPLPLPEAGGGQGTVRRYSLVHEDADTVDADADDYGAAPAHYAIAVKRNPQGRGGSAWLHDVLAVGDVLQASAPVQAFGTAAGAAHHVLVAGGIGITPLLGLAAQLRSAGASYELHYSARGPADMAYRDEVLHAHGGRCSLYFTRGGGDGGLHRLDVAALLARHAGRAGTHVYVCGPAALIDTVRLGALAQGLPRARIHFESFGPAWEAGDAPVHLVLTESALALDVAPGTPLLDAMEAAGAWVPADCRRGECGACITSYSAGRPIHRDHCLTPEQRLHSFCPCVSWAAPGEALAVLA